MKAQIIHSEEVNPEQFEAISVKELLDRNDSPDMSCALIKLDGKNKKNKNLGTDSYYFVLDGAGTFTIMDMEYNVKKGDLIRIPKGIEYFDSGKMTLLSFCSPRFDPEKVKYL